MGRPFFVYMLRCADGSYYVGQTDDLDRRIAEHTEGGKCQYTTQRRPVSMLWAQEVPTREEARAIEAQMKRWSRVKKEALALGRFDVLRDAAKKTFRQARG